MKKIIICLLMLITATTAFAQKASLTKAYNFYYDKDYVKAKEAIDLCITDEKLSTKAQTWLYRGNIYYFLANSEYGAKQKDESYTIQYPDAPVEAYDSFLKSKEINAKAEAMDMFNANDAMKQLYPLLLVRGVDQMIAGDYKTAKSTLEKGIASYEMDKPQYPMNGDLYYYYAYTLEMLGESSAAQVNYEKAIKDGTTNAYVYVKQMEALKQDNKADLVYETLQAALQKIPDDISIKLAEIDYYYWKGDSIKARTLLKSIPTNSIRNADEMVNLSNFYIREKSYEEAFSLLERANNVSPNTFVVLYNLGVCSYNISEKHATESNQMAINGGNDSKVKEHKDLSEQYLAKAAAYFEQACLMEPKDLGLLNTLRAIYARQQSSKYDDIDKIIKELEK